MPKPSRVNPPPPLPPQPEDRSLSAGAPRSVSSAAQRHQRSHRHHHAQSQYEAMHYRWDTSSLPQTKEDVQQSLPLMQAHFTTSRFTYTHLTASAVSHANLVMSPVNKTWANTQTLQRGARRRFRQPSGREMKSGGTYLMQRSLVDTGACGDTGKGSQGHLHQNLVKITRLDAGPERASCRGLC